jgi:uncharacterized protein (DUF305 family)
MTHINSATFHSPARGLRATLAAAVVAATLVLSGCSINIGSDDHMDGDHMGTSAGSESDVMFAQMMIPHHQQAVEMSILAETRASSPEIKALAAEIKQAQQPEIDLMTVWLNEWDAPVLTGDDAMGAHSGHGMAGMLTDEQLAALANSSGPEFDTLFAEYMIEHHEGAIDMAQAVADSSDARVAELAQGIIETQRAEIAELEAFLAAQG